MNILFIGIVLLSSLSISNCQNHVVNTRSGSFLLDDQNRTLGKFRPDGSLHQYSSNIPNSDPLTFPPNVGPEDQRTWSSNRQNQGAQGSYPTSKPNPFDNNSKQEFDPVANNANKKTIPAKDDERSDDSEDNDRIIHYPQNEDENLDSLGQNRPIRPQLPPVLKPGNFPDPINKIRPQVSQSPVFNSPQNEDPIDYQQTGFQRPIPNREQEDPQNYQPIRNFAWNLFKNSNTQPNFVISPLSPQILLAYLAWAAEGSTRSEIKNANGYGSPKTLRKLVSSMLKSGKSRELQIATAFFVSEEMRLNEEFLKEAVKEVDVVNVNFKFPRKASETITKWVSQKTKNGLKINQIEFSPATKVAMTSTIYFKGKWIYRFQAAQTDNFYAPEGIIKVPMMNMKRKFKWGQIDDYAQWAALPYESDDSLIIILPNQGRSLDEVISRLDDVAFSDVLQKMDSGESSADVNITLPRFKLESTTNLVQPLNKMGIYNLFSPRAELPYLSDYDAVQVTNAQQQSSLDINENGTVLVSFTNVNVIALSFQPTIPDVEFKVDRPFLAIVADRANGVPLVIAKVTNPLK